MLWYLASPYSKYEAGFEAAFTDASKAAGALMQRGLNVFSPIAHSHPIATYGKIDETDHGFWLPQSMAVLERSDVLAVAMMPGWETSHGIAEELRRAKALGIPTKLLTWPDLQERRQPRVMVLGNARHGKDTVCAILKRDYGLTFESSSHFVAERAVRPALAADGITYDSFDDMYADRVNRRAAWFDAIAAYNSPDLARLGKELYGQHDLYCGIRNKAELNELKRQGIVEFTIWVDASRRCDPESRTSCSVDANDADFILDNNGPVEALPEQVMLAMAAAGIAGP